VQTRIAEENFRHAPRRRVFVKYRLDIFSQAFEHGFYPSTVKRYNIVFFLALIIPYFSGVLRYMKSMSVVVIVD
jgi:hypothetical protein